MKRKIDFTESILRNVKFWYVGGISFKSFSFWLYFHWKTKTTEPTKKIANIILFHTSLFLYETKNQENNLIT